MDSHNIQSLRVNKSIFVDNICIISISDIVSDGATKTLVVNIERAQHD